MIKKPRKNIQKVYWKEANLQKSVERGFLFLLPPLPHIFKWVFKYEIKWGDGEEMSFWDENLGETKVGE